MFKIGEYIVYPNQGLGKIVNIENIEFRGAPEKYYIINIEGSDMVIKIPEASIEKLGVRPLTPKKEAEKIYKNLHFEQEKATSDWKLRYNSSLESLKKAGIEDFIKVVKTLNNRSKVKELPIMEKKLYEQAWGLLINELAISLEKDVKSIEKTLREKLDITDREDDSSIYDEKFDEVDLIEEDVDDDEDEQ